MTIYVDILKLSIERKLQVLEDNGGFTTDVSLMLLRVNLGDISLYEFLEYVDRIELVAEVDGNV